MLQPHTFKLAAPEGYIAMMHGAGTISSEPVAPETYALIELESTIFNDMRDDLIKVGWVYVGSGDQRPTPPARLLKVARERLTADALSPITGTGYQSVLTASLEAEADHVLEIEAAGSAAVLLALGNARLTIDGTAIGTPVPLEILGVSAFRLAWYLPTAANEYDVVLQMNAGTIGSVTPQAGCVLFLREYDR